MLPGGGLPVKKRLPPTTPRRISFSLGQPGPSAPHRPRPPLGRLSPRRAARGSSTLRARAAQPARGANPPPRAPPPRRVEAMGGGASTAATPAPDNQRQRQTSDALNQMPVETLQEVVTVRSRLSRIRLSFIRPSLSPPEDGTGLLPQMRKILENDGDLLDFTNFLMREFADEPLQFYAAIADFTSQFGTPTEKKRGMVELPRRFTTVEEGPDEDDTIEEVADSKTEARQAAAREIFDEFLATDAPRQVHVPAKMRKALKKELDAGLCLPAVFRPALGEVLTALARDKLVPFVTHQRNDKKIWIRVLRILESSVASEKRQSFRGGAPKPDPASPGRARQPTMATVPKKRFDHRRLSVDVRMVVARELDLEELRKKHAAATKA